MLSKSWRLARFFFRGDVAEIKHWHRLVIGGQTGGSQCGLGCPAAWLVKAGFSYPPRCRVAGQTARELRGGQGAGQVLRVNPDIAPARPGRRAPAICLQGRILDGKNRYPS